MRNHTHCGRGFEVLASFTGEDRARQAAEYVRTHLHVKVLFANAGETLIVRDRGAGKPADAQDSDFGNVGWNSIYDAGGAA
jgi:hypothetical protein